VCFILGAVRKTAQIPLSKQKLLHIVTSKSIRVVSNRGAVPAEVEAVYLTNTTYDASPDTVIRDKADIDVSGASLM
jgi:hypothetical protein